MNSETFFAVEPSMTYLSIEWHLLFNWQRSLSQTLVSFKIAQPFKSLLANMEYTYTVVHCYCTIMFFIINTHCIPWGLQLTVVHCKTSLLLNHFLQIKHCNTPCCWCTGFGRSSIHLCLALSCFLLNVLSHTTHCTVGNTSLVSF